MKKFILLISIFLTVGTNAVVAQERAMTPEDLWKFGRVSEPQVSPDNANVIYGVTYYNAEDNSSNRDIYLLNIKENKSVNISKSTVSEYNAVFHPTDGKIYYLAPVKGEMQMFSMSMKGSSKKQVSFVTGGIEGFKFSPDGEKVVYYTSVKLDETPSEIYPDLNDVDVKIIDDLMYRHWDNWSDYTYNHLFVSSFDSKGQIHDGIDLMENQKFDAPMKPFGGMEQVDWSPDGNELAYACKKLSGKDYAVSTNSDIFIYNLTTKQTKNVSAFNMGYDHDPVFSPNGEYLVWKSMKTPGFEADKERIMLYSIKKRMIADLTDGFDQSCANYKWSDDSKTIYFISGHHAKYHLYSIDVETQSIRKITSGQCDYVEYDLAGNFIVAAKQSMSLPTELFLVDIATGKDVQLTFTNEKLLEELRFGRVEERWIKTVDDKDMLVWVIYPPFFDVKDKYPAILYCEGGPQSAVSQFWSYRWNFQMMAAGGYIVMAPNRRGLPTFGQEWNDQISGDYGGLNQKDYLQTVDVLSKEPYIDENRIGAVGASYGGFSVYWLAGNHNKRFKAFISHCGIYNFSSMYGSTEEYFFVNHDYEGPYWTVPQPKSYAFSPHLAVANWDTPILIITGGRDFRIPYTQSLEAFNSAQLLGVPSKLLFFPDETHFVLKPQNSILWQREFRNWLDKYLK